MLVEALRLLPSVARSRLSPKVPYKALIAVTNRCNCHCTTCQIWRNQSVVHDLAPHALTSILTSAPFLRWIDLTGGEPMVRDDFLQLAQAVNRSQTPLLFVHFATNGTFPERAEVFARSLARTRRWKVVATVSIDAPGDVHDRLRGRPGTSEAAWETVVRLSQVPGVETYIGTTISKDNIDLVHKMRPYIEPLLKVIGPDHWHMNLMTRSSHFFRNASLTSVDTEAAIQALQRFEQARARPLSAFALLEFAFARNLRLWLRSQDAPVACEALAASVFISSDGGLYPCHVRNTHLGSLAETNWNLSKALDATAVSKERSAIVAENCALCFTPCEAYHAIAGHPVCALVNSLRS